MTNEWRIIPAVSGDYSCRADTDDNKTEWSEALRLTVSTDKPKATLTADPTIIPAGGSITLTCSVDGSDDWKFDWFRDDEPVQLSGTNEQQSDVSVSEGVSAPTVKQHPSWPVVFRGETVTLRCEMEDDEGTQWTYEWNPANRNSPTSNEYRINSVSESDTDKPRATLTAHRTIIPAGGSITLTCSVDESDDWKFDWFRNDRQYFATRFRGNKDPFRVISVSEGGLYRCRGGRGNPVFHTETSNIQKIVSAPTVKQHPSWPVVFTGETVTLRCEMEDDEGTQWTYEWSPDNRNSPTSNEYRINSVSESDTYKPRATLTADPTTIPAGGSTTLTCSVAGSTGWKFDWFRDEEPVQLRGTNEQQSDVSVSEGGVYSCRGGRGNPVYQTEESKKVSVLKTVFKPTVILQPSGSVVYRGEKVTLRCEIKEGGRTQWTYEWRTNNRNIQIRSSEYSINKVSEYHSGVYSCMATGDHQQTEWSDGVTLTVKPNHPKASLTASNNIIPAGGSVTLTCLIDIGVGWKFDWFKLESDSSAAQSIRTSESDGVLVISEGGEYGCRGGRGDPVFYTETSGKVTIEKRVPITPTVIQQPNWSQIYRGEEITEMITTNRNSPTSSKSMITADSSGDYKCRGRRDGFTITKWGVITLTVSSPKPQPVLSVSPSWPNPGASVTLSCEGLELQSAGWRFFWYKVVPIPISTSYSIELLPNTINRTEQNSFIINGPTQTAGYQCRAGRGEPKFYTNYSEVKFIWSADSHPAAFLSVSPDRVQHFIDQSVTLNCSGNNTKWRVKRFTESTSPSYVQCFHWGMMSGSSCTIKRLEDHSGVYWCESGSGEFSNAVNITVHDDGVILVSPVHPVTEGDPVTLSCRNETQFLSNVFYYHNDKLINNDSREELKISAVSKSDEGFYKCQHSGKKSLNSWMSIRGTVSSPVPSSSPLLLIIGPISGIILIIFLLLLWRYKQHKDLCSFRSEKNSQRSTINQGAENEFSVSSSATPAEPSEVTYTAIKFKKLRKKRKPRKPEEPVIYAEVNTSAAGKVSRTLYQNVSSCQYPAELAPTYAEINKNRAKRNRREKPAATDESVYSEIKSGATLEDKRWEQLAEVNG
ncbi:titin-like [Poeciliopsis prolifica]|uniref:titin-like n=1 Tax=Poeciliopsis prolifica TaxID=188132 RepID=UPI0024142446|nr:titin-like [Poeciliopsis prolifica]